MPDEVGGGLAQLDSGFLGLLGEELVIQWRHLAIGSDVVLLKGLLELGMLVEERADLRTEQVHYRH